MSEPWFNLRELFIRLEEQFGCGPGMGPGSGTRLLKVESVAPTLIQALYRSAAALSRTQPWSRFRPSHLFSVRVAKDSDWTSKKPPFSSALFTGSLSGHRGLLFFRSDDDARTFTSSATNNSLPANADVLRVVFQPLHLLPSPTRRLVRFLSLEPSQGPPDLYPVFDVARLSSSSPLGPPRFRNPSSDELRFALAFMNAFSLLHSLVPHYSSPFIETVDVHWPLDLPRFSSSSSSVAVTVSHPPGLSYGDLRLLPPSPSTIADNNAAAANNDNWASSAAAAPRVCAICDMEVPGEHSVCCGRCRALVYCTAACQKQHWKEGHKSLCGLFKAMMEREEELAMKIFVFPCAVNHPCKWLESAGLHRKGMWRRRCGCYSNCPFGLLPQKGLNSDSWGGLDHGEYPLDSPFDSSLGLSSPILLSGWSEYYNLRSLPLLSPVATLLCHPLTLYHILTALSIGSKNLLLKGREVVVHYLGPEAELDWMLAFAEIGHLLNGSGNLQIVMVGPEVPSDLSGTVLGIGSRVRVNFVRGLYQEEATYLPSPHAIVGLNSGLENGGSWVGALELVKSMNVPAFFTDQSEISCVNAKQVLRAAGLHITHPVMPNPFRSPLRNQAPSSNLPSYSNGFVFGINT